jgi:NAD(P)-dependent dehydrogenase (short-subunit alcohol dehydrogenase family)
VSGRLSGRLALIAGASRGIGAAVAKRFAAEGAHVVLTGRTVGGLEATDDAIRAAGGSATLSPFDLTDFDAIDRLGGVLAERYGHLDVLVGNAAALGQLSPMGHIPPDVWDEVVGVNLTAQWRLIRAFDPLLRAADAGRAIFVTSSVASQPHAYWGVYAATKAALENMVRTWAAELMKTRVRVNLIDPGAVRTAMRAAAYPGEDPQTLPPPEAVTERFVELAEDACARHGEVVRAVD